MAFFFPVTSAAVVGEEVLELQGADLNIKENGKLHHTSRFYVMNEHKSHKARSLQLVVRRGQEFSLALEFNRPYKKGADVIQLDFNLHDSRGHHHHHQEKSSEISFNPSLVHVPVKDAPSTLQKVTHLLDAKSSHSTNGWFAHVDSVHGSKVTIKVKAPARCPVAKWDLHIQLQAPKYKSSRTYKFNHPLYMLFNPWNSEDTTYYSCKQEHLNEYVLSDMGTIYVGRHGDGEPYGKSWAFGQYAPDILDCALYLLDHSCKIEDRLTVPERADPVRIVRRLTYVLNYDDMEKDGVLEGKWAKDQSEYSDGTNPSAWSGSKEILQTYYRAKLAKPHENAAVKYGQCWVYASLLTTICRALGIPARVVTNYKSGHERKANGYSFSIDYYYNEAGEKVHPKGHGENDSIWSFHVWAETWMKREDLPAPYSGGGWQAVDATAQETSTEVLNKGAEREKAIQIMQMGPAPLAAVKQGDVHINYDVDFVFGEVNADIVGWTLVGENKHNFRFVKSTDEVGEKISTEDVENKGERKDITNEYKHPEKTKEERESMRNALERANLDYSRVFQNECAEISLAAKLYHAFVGAPIKFDIIVTNKSKAQQTGSGWVHVSTAPSSSEISDLVEKFPLKYDLGPEQHKQYTFVVDYDKYKDKLKTCATDLSIEYSVQGTTEQAAYFGQSYISFSKPRIVLDAPSSITQNEKLTARIQFSNPTPIALDVGKFTIQGPNFKRTQKEQELKNPLKPGESTEFSFELEPNSTGKHPIAVDFYSPSTQFTAHGVTEVEVVAA